MRQGLRENAACAAMAAAGCSALAWLGLYGFAWNDYDNEARPAVDALVHGQLGDFLRLAPTYGGSLIERAPFALLPRLWHGSELAVYRMLAVPCLLAAAVLGVWLLVRMRAEGRPRLERGVALALCAANPIMLPALELGHPEEMLGGCLVVAAVLLAAGAGTRPRPLLAGAVLGLAIANKEWALLATGPVLLAIPPGLRLRCLATAGAATGAVLAPLALASGGFVAATRAVASQASPIFQPWQIWWFLGHHGALVHGLFGTPKPGYRQAPQWTGIVAHPLIMLCGAAIAAALWLRRRRLAEGEALLALTLVLLLRCLLDTWDAVYYTLPFLVALLFWEARSRPQSPPALTLLATVLTWASFEWLPHRVSADAQAALFLCWSLPLAAWLGAQLLTGGASASPRPSRARARYETTVSFLGIVVRASPPSSLRITRSSMRTPSSPGR